jgi:hypothetical protein
MIEKRDGKFAQNISQKNGQRNKSVMGMLNYQAGSPHQKKKPNIQIPHRNGHMNVTFV